MIWPCVPVVVPAELQGTAYGIMTSFQNAGQFVVPLVLQQAYHYSHSYEPCEAFFIKSSAAAALVALLLWAVDEKCNRGTLRLPEVVATSGGSGGIVGCVSENALHTSSSTTAGNDIESNGKIVNNHYSGNGHDRKCSNDRDVTAVNNKNHNSNNNDGVVIRTGSMKINVPQLNLNGHNTNNAHHNSNSNHNNHNNNVAGAPAGGFIGENKFSRLRAFSMSAADRYSSNAMMSTINEHSSRDSPTEHSNNSNSNNHNGNSNNKDNMSSQASSPSSQPMMLITLPNVVHHSLEYYQRANSFQFPKEDPLLLRRIITEHHRSQPPPHAQAHFAQSAPQYSESQMQQYQRYRQQQVMQHNQMSQLEQQEHLILGTSQQRSPRSRI